MAILRSFTGATLPFFPPSSRRTDRLELVFSVHSRARPYHPGEQCQGHAQQNHLTPARIRINFQQMSGTHSMTNGMTITVHVPGPLRDCCAGASELALSATSVRAVLEEL